MTTPIAHGRFVQLGDLHLDHVHWTNIRTFTGLDEEALAELGADLKERGILVPPKVQKVLVDGKVIDLVIDGQRRVRSALGVMPPSTLIEVIDRTQDPIELTPQAADEITIEALAISERREGLSSYELSEVAEQLRSRDHSLLAIGKAIGRSESWVSKILKARGLASPEIMLDWKKGALTDEQFKDLAAVNKDAQASALAEVREAKSTGDATQARKLAREAKERANGQANGQSNGHANGQAHGKAKTGKSTGKAKANGRTVVAGEQTEMWAKPPEVKKKSAAPKRLVLEEMLALKNKLPPTNDYVKGIMDCVRFALDQGAIEEFGSPWRQYLARAAGDAPRKKQSRKPGKAPKAPKAGKTRKPRKAPKVITWDGERSKPVTGKVTGKGRKAGKGRKVAKPRRPSELRSGLITGPRKSVKSANQETFL